MPEPTAPNFPKKDGNKKSNWSRLSKTLSFWLLVILIPFAFIQFSSNRADPAPTITYSAYDRELQRGNITKVTVVAGSEINGEFAKSVNVAGRDVKKFHVLWPVGPAGGSDAEISRLREKGVEIEAKQASTSLAQILITVLPWIVIIGAWLFLLRNMQASGAKAFSFGKSKAKLLSGDTPKITFVDVAGADEAKIELQEIIEFLKDPAKFTRLGGRLPKGALLVGPLSKFFDPLLRADGTYNRTCNCMALVCTACGLHLLGFCFFIASCTMIYILI